MRKRSLSDMAVIAEIVASIAVVISLVFVGFQVQRNTVELQAAQGNDLFDAIREIELTMLSSPHLVEIYAKGWGDRRDEMSQAEVETYRLYLMQSFTIWEQAHARMRDGTISSHDYTEWVELFTGYIEHGTTPEDIEYMLPWMNERFARELNELAETIHE